MLSSRRARTLVLAVLGPLLVAAAVVLPVGSAAAVPPSCAGAGFTVTSLGGPNFYIDGGNSPAFRSGYTGYRITNATGSAVDDVWAQLSGFTGGALGLAATQPAAQRVGALSSDQAEARFWYLTASALSGTAQNHTVTLYSHDPALPNAVALCSTSGGFSSVQGTIEAAANKVDNVTVSGGAPNLGSRFTVTVTGTTGTIGSGIANDIQSFWMTPAVLDAWPAGSFRLLTTKLTISPDGRAADQDYVDTLRVAGLGSAARPYTAAYTFQAVGTTSSATTVEPVQEIASGTQVKHTGTYPTTIPAIPSPVNDLSLAVAASSPQLGLGGGTTSLTGTVTGTAGAELDSFSMVLPTGATVVPDSARWGSTTLPDPVVSNGTLVFPGPFVVGSGSLTVDLAFDGTPGTRTATLAGMIGTTQIGSAAGSSTPASVGVDVDTAPTARDSTATTRPGTPVQINLAGLVDDADGDDLTLVVPQPDHGTVELSGTTATYTPDDGFEGDDPLAWTVSDGRGGSADAVVTVTVDPAAPQPVPLTPQVIDLPAPDALEAGGRVQLTATADSGLPVTYRSTTPELCTVDGATVTAVAAGECTVVAEQTGDDTYAPAPTVSRTVTVAAPAVPAAPASQSLTFTASASLLGTAPYALTASASSGLPVVFSVTRGDCALRDGTLTPNGADTCTVEAAQAGDATYAAATPVSRSIAFVVPADDAVATDGATGVTTDVLANDPAGVTLASVTAPAHGTATLTRGRVRYVPRQSFRGTDRFRYAVTRQGRSASATVTVTVANQPPMAHGGSVAQLAGTTARLGLRASDPNADRLSLTAVSDEPGVAASVERGTLVLRASAAVSGAVTVTVTVRDRAGGTTRVTVRDRVRPLAPAWVHRRLSPGRTAVSWSAAPTRGASYDVVVDGAVRCHTSRPRCALHQVLGPRRKVYVRTVGHDDTRSARTSAPLTGHGQVLVTTVYFASGLAALTPSDRRTLDAAIRTVHAFGFGVAALDGYTDADGGLAFNLRLSHRRTRTVAAYLHSQGRLGSVQAWHGESHPVASNHGVSGKARNRRVEILVRY